jgi:hypothetical protein
MPFAAPEGPRDAALAPTHVTEPSRISHDQMKSSPRKRSWPPPPACPFLTQRTPPVKSFGGAGTSMPAASATQRRGADFEIWFVLNPAVADDVDGDGWEADAWMASC